MHRTMKTILLECCFLLAAATWAAAVKTPNVNNLCFADGLKYKTIQSAIEACGANGTVVITPSYSASDTFSNPDGIAVFDFRHNERQEGLNPVTEFGAKGDAVNGADGVSQSGSATFSSASASFLGRDAGKTIIITGAGPENASLRTTIASVNGPNRVTLATAAGFTATGLTYWYGTDNTSAMETAYRAQKPLFLPSGKYL